MYFPHHSSVSTTLPDSNRFPSKALSSSLTHDSTYEIRTAKTASFMIDSGWFDYSRARLEGVSVTMWVSRPLRGSVDCRGRTGPGGAPEACDAGLLDLQPVAYRHRTETTGEGKIHPQPALEAEEEQTVNSKYERRTVNVQQIPRLSFHGGKFRKRDMS